MKTVLLFACIIIILIFSSCSSSNSDNSSVAPQITNLRLYDSTGTMTENFKIGDTAYISITVSDPDLDASFFLITSYYLSYSADTPYFGPTIYDLQEQSHRDTVYQVGFTTSGPLGEWRIEFQIEDSAGNESNIVSSTINKYS